VSDTFIVEYDDCGLLYQLHHVPGRDGHYSVRYQIDFGDTGHDRNGQEVATFEYDPYSDSDMFREELIDVAIDAVAAAEREAVASGE
jgi:hypothetical protein